MDIELGFKSHPPGARPIWLTVRKKDGTLLELDWDDAMISSYLDQASFSAFGLVCADDGGHRPDPEDFEGAELVDASWRDADERPFGGSIEILSAAAKSPDGKEYPLLKTPLSLPKEIDYTKLDRAVRDAVKYLNRCGLRTKSSYGGQGLMKIVFHRSVAESDLRDFKGGQPAEGRFCILLEPDRKYAFAYVAATPASIGRDLAQWMLRNPIGGNENA